MKAVEYLCCCRNDDESIMDSAKRHEEMDLFGTGRHGHDGGENACVGCVVHAPDMGLGQMPFKAVPV